MMRELCHSVHHLLQRCCVGVTQGSCLGGQNNTLEQFTQLVAGVHHSVAHVLSSHLPGERVPNEHEFVSAQNDEFAVCHEDPGGLRRLDTTEKGIDGVQKGVEVSLTLVGVEQKQAAVMGGLEGLWRLPFGDVILHWLCDLLLQTLKLIDLKGKTKAPISKYSRKMLLRITISLCASGHPWVSYADLMLSKKQQYYFLGSSALITVNPNMQSSEGKNIQNTSFALKNPNNTNS